MHFAFAFPVLLILAGIAYAFYHFVVRPKTTVKAGVAALESTAKADAAKIATAAKTELKVAEGVVAEVKGEAVNTIGTAITDAKNLL